MKMSPFGAVRTSRGFCSAVANSFTVNPGGTAGAAFVGADTTCGPLPADRVAYGLRQVIHCKMMLRPWRLALPVVRIRPSGSCRRGFVFQCHTFRDLQRLQIRDNIRAIASHPPPESASSCRAVTTIGFARNRYNVAGSHVKPDSRIAFV